MGKSRHPWWPLGVQEFLQACMDNAGGWRAGVGGDDPACIKAQGPREGHHREPSTT